MEFSRSYEAFPMTTKSWRCTDLFFQSQLIYPCFLPSLVLLKCMIDFDSLPSFLLRIHLLFHLPSQKIKQSVLNVQNQTCHSKEEGKGIKWNEATKEWRRRMMREEVKERTKKINIEVSWCTLEKYCTLWFHGMHFLPLFSSCQEKQLSAMRYCTTFPFIVISKVT